MGSTYVQSLGDDCLEVSVAATSDAQNLAIALRQADAFLDVVVGVASVAVRYDAAAMSRQQAETVVQNCLRVDVSSDVGNSTELVMPVTYGGADGPDLALVCEQLCLSTGEFITQHTSVSHAVEMLGFTPGFAYLQDMGAAYSVARLATPRSRIVAGSIGFAGGRTGIYALPGPGGWPLIGRTEQRLFDRDAADPFLVEAGMRIRFVNVA